MFVYRVELPNGTGPWCDNAGRWHGYADSSITGHTQELSLWSSPCCIRVSWPQHEKGSWRFGFTNWKQFFNYCSGSNIRDKEIKERKLRALNIIKEKGMFISVYEIEDEHVIDDKYSQCVFRIAEATLVESLDSLSDVVMKQLSIYLSEPIKKE